MLAVLHWHYVHSHAHWKAGVLLICYMRKVTCKMRNVECGMEYGMTVHRMNTPPPHQPYARHMY